MPYHGPKFERRHFLGAVVTALMGLVAFFLGKRTRPLPGSMLRPPGALEEPAFQDACTRCLKCKSICPNDCIEFLGFEAGLDKAYTPYIDARARGCILCGLCAEACPTGALRPFEASEEGWLSGVKMGTARVNKDMCYSYHGRTCGACYRACPLAGRAMRIGLYETPVLDPENCVGCGLCEQACLHLPQAIRVIPSRTRQPAKVILSQAALEVPT